MEENTGEEFGGELAEAVMAAGFEIIRESVRACLDNGGLAESDLDDFNRAAADGTAYQGAVCPPVYDWSGLDPELGEILAEDAAGYAETYIARKGGGPGADRVFAVALLRIADVRSGEKGLAYLKWNPEGYAERAAGILREEAKAESR